MLRCDIRRTKNHAASDAIEFDQRQSGGQLILCEEQDAPVTQLLEPPAKARCVCELSERDDVAETAELTAV